jgi:DNA (cytosine-5)-methyltransferase 1
MDILRHGSLFSGIGGFDLAAQWMGWQNVFQVEIDEYCHKVLNKNFPNVKKYKDIKEFSGSEFKGAVDVISGGFPCQPFSTAGKRTGAHDDRYLWPEMFRVFRESEASYLVGENVTGLLSLDGGSVIETILTDLEAEGYQWEIFVLPAAAVQGWHKRERVFIIAYSNSLRLEASSYDQKLYRKKDKDGGLSYQSLLSMPMRDGSVQGGTSGCGKSDGIPHRLDRVKALGNAIVPQVAYEIFRAIDMYHRNL